MWERARAVGDMFSVVGDKASVEPVHGGGPKIAPLGGECLLDHAPRAAADHRTSLVVGHRRQFVLGQGEVERIDQVWRGIDQRAVEIEDDSQHGLA